MISAGVFLSLLNLVLLYTVHIEGVAVKFPSLDALKAESSRSDQENAVRELLRRKIPNHESQFELHIDLQSTDDDQFIVENSVTGQIAIHGTSGPAVAYGIYTYLRTCCKVQFSWDGDQVDLPAQLPLLKRKIIKNSIGRFRYFSNVCTFSYSFVWWGWEEWEKAIDWLALNGFNLVLAEVGTEAVWQNVWRAFGLSQAETDDHFTGPAFLAWLRMGNLKKWGGPLSQSWHRTQADLQRNITKRMVKLGMVPVLPAFAGHVPDALPKYYPRANFSKVSCWARFREPYSCLQMIDPVDPFYKTIGSAFLRELKKMYGLYHAYDADPFNEMRPRSYDRSYVQAVARSIFGAMLDVDPEAIWVKQAWFFVNDDRWLGKAGKYFLTAIPSGRMLLLDLDAYRIPIWSKTKSFYGQPFIWNIVHDYGGVLGMQGPIETMNQGVTKAIQYHNSSLVGTGLMMEGIFQNYVVYQFMNDKGWSLENIDLENWIPSYANERYGSDDNVLQSSWGWMIKTLYGIQSIRSQSGRLGDYRDLGKYQLSHDNYGLFTRPTMKNKLTLWYNSSILCEIWRNFTVQSSRHNSSNLFRLDLVDIARETLVLIGNVYYHDVVNAYNSKNQTGLKVSGEKLMQLFDDLEAILGTHDHFLLGKWIKQARRKATNQMEADLYEYNFRNQVTLWGPDGEIVDYARKQWAGIMKGYYKLRWKLFVETLENCLRKKTPFKQRAFDRNVLERVEKPFTYTRSDEPNRPVGDSIAKNKKLFHIYYEQCKAMNLHPL